MQELLSMEKLRSVYAIAFGGILFYIWDQFAHWAVETAGHDAWYNNRFLYDPGLPPCGAVNFLIIAGLSLYAFHTGRRTLLLGLLIPTIFSVTILYLTLAQYIFKGL